MWRHDGRDVGEWMGLLEVVVLVSGVCSAFLGAADTHRVGSVCFVISGLGIERAMLLSHALTLILNCPLI